MRLMEFLGVRPTLPGLASRIISALPAHDRRQWTFDAESGTLKDEAGAQISLQNMFLEYTNSGVMARGALVRKYSDIASAQSREIPAYWVASMRNVIPVVRSEFVESALQIKFRATGTTFEQVVLPLAGDLRIRLVYDFGTFVRYVQPEHLATWGKSVEDVLAQALANLGALDAPVWRDLGHGVFRLISTMSYAESMLQLDKVLRALPFAEHAVLMPCNRGILLASDERSEDGMKAMLEEAARCLHAEPWPMSGVICRRHAGSWEVIELPARLSQLAHSLEVQHLAQVYVDQKSQLEAVNEEAGRDVYVAEFALFGKDGIFESYSVWTEGVGTLLPATDWVAVNPDGEARDFVRVTWQDLRRTCGARLAPTSDHPPRYLVNSFPDADEWSALNRLAASD